MTRADRISTILAGSTRRCLALDSASGGPGMWVAMGSNTFGRRYMVCHVS